MKKILTKLLLASLLFLAAIPTGAQANFFSWNTLRDGAIAIGRKTVNWLSTNGKTTFNFLKKHPIIVGTIVVGGTVVGTAFIWKLLKERLRLANEKRQTTNFWLAIENENEPEAWKAIELGASVKNLNTDPTSFYTQNRVTPLIIAVIAENPKIEIIEFILKNNAPVDVKSKHGCTALGVAITSSKWDIVHMLLKYGADPLIKIKVDNLKGMDAFDIINLADDNNETKQLKKDMQKIVENKN